MASSRSIPTLYVGTPLAKARAAIILIHGRGASGDDIAGLAESLPTEGIAYLAPSAETGAWYPQRFFVPLAQNEPDLSKALNVIDTCVGEARAAGIPFERIGLIGFSQGACLSLEYVARRPQRYGLIGALSGGLIGPLDTPRPAIDLQSTPVLIACAEADPHIPLAYVEHSAVAFTQFKAEVTKQIFRGGAHTVFPEEMAWLVKRLSEF